MPQSLLNALEAYAARFRLRPVREVLAGVKPQPWWAK